MGRPPCCDKSNVKRGLWTPEEDAKILAYVSNHGIGNWTLVPKKAGLNRCGKSCRLRWTNYLRPDLKHDSFTPQEEEMIINLHEAIGSRWSLIAKRLPGRTDNDVKNHWNTKLRKKLMKMGIDPVTHKPVSQVLSDLGSISGLPTTGNQMLPLRTEACAAQYSSGPASGSGGTKRKLMVEQAQDDECHQREHQVQFQVINPAANVSNEAASSCSSSCSSNLTRLSSPQSQNTHPCSSFDWSEFLLSDPFMWAEFQQLQQYEMQGVLSSLSPSVQMQNEIQLFNNTKGNKQGAASEDSMVVNAYEASMEYQINKQYEGSSSSGNSFVDDILDRDSEIRAAIPDLLDASLDY